MKSTFYNCPECGKEVEVMEGMPVPQCCGEPMNVCTHAEVAEHSRPFNEDEPCDDGRAGK